MNGTGQHAGKAPRVCVGMPVYNEAGHIEAALESLLAQDHPRLEVIVSDNGSTDATEDICRRIAARDARLTYIRQPYNRGVVFNFQVVMQEADCDYFMWASGHDLWSPNLVSACVRVLEADPQVVLAHGTCHWIDQHGQRLDMISDRADTRGMDVIGRVHTVFWGSMNPVLGLMRRSALDRTRATEDSTVGNDLVLLTEMTLLGSFAHVPEAHFSRRLFRAPERLEDRMKRFTGEAFKHRVKRIDRLFPLARLPVKLMQAIGRSALPWPDRLLLGLSLLASMPARYRVGRRGVR